MARFDGPIEASRWIPSVLGPGPSELYNQNPIYGFPVSGFQDREEYLLWKEEWYPGLLKLLPTPLSP